MPKRTTSHRSWLLEQLGDPVMAAAYVNDAICESPETLPKVLRNVAEARKMKNVAEEAGVNRETLYRTLSEKGNPTWETLLAIFASLRLRFKVEPEDYATSTESGSGSVSNRFEPNQESTSGSVTSTSMWGIGQSFVTLTIGRPMAVVTPSGAETSPGIAIAQSA